MTVYHSLCSKSITSWRTPYTLMRTGSKSSAIFFHGWLCCWFLQPENRYIWYSVFHTAVLKDLVMYQYNGSPHFDVCENWQATDCILCPAWQSVTKFCHQFFRKLLRGQITVNRILQGVALLILKCPDTPMIEDGMIVIFDRETKSVVGISNTTILQM